MEVNLKNENNEYYSILRLCEKMLHENNQDRPTFYQIIQEIKNQNKYQFDESYKLEISNQVMYEI